MWFEQGDLPTSVSKMWAALYSAPAWTPAGHQGLSRMKVVRSLVCSWSRFIPNRVHGFDGAQPLIDTPPRGGSRESTRRWCWQSGAVQPSPLAIGVIGDAEPAMPGVTFEEGNGSCSKSAFF